VATAVFFHAHPDDETLFTGGTMARAAAEGHRVVLVTATRGERGHDHGGVLSPDESLADRRAAELAEAGRLLGVARQEWLGYGDSGAKDRGSEGGSDVDGPGVDGPGVDGPADADARADGTEDAASKRPFSQVPLEEAGGRLAEILTEERADVVTTYDDWGGYGHPDHVHAHRVATLAARLTGGPSGGPALYGATFDRDRIRGLLDMAIHFGLTITDDIRAWSEQLGVPADKISTTVDVSAWIDHKRRAMAAHATQFPASSWFMGLPAPAFQLLFGTEWFIEQDGESGRRWLFEA
jgi:LmbE family N-acetylglucosaminyl deacetylase